MNWHLVVGGSHGIGRAYAEFAAARGDCVHILGRNREALLLTADALRDIGSPEVEATSCDVSRRNERRAFFARHHAERYFTVLLGGPSPPAGNPPSRLDLNGLRRGAEIVCLYPLEFLHWLSVRQSRAVVRIISSSAAVEPLKNHEFFWSGLFRRGQDELVEALRSGGMLGQLRVDIWYPRVVLTRLSLRYAEAMGGSQAGVSPEDLLRKHFSVDAVPTAAEFVFAQLTAGQNSSAEFGSD